MTGSEGKLSRSSSSSTFFISSADEDDDNLCITKSIIGLSESKTARYEEMQMLFKRLEFKSSTEELSKSSSLSSLNDEMGIDFETPDRPDNITFDDNGNVHSATAPKLVEKLTTVVDNGLIEDFMLTFRCFLTLQQFTHLILSRLRYSFTSTTPHHQQIRVRTFVVIRHWLQAYWDVDFEGNDDVIKILVKGLDECWKGAKELQSGDKQLLLKLRHLLCQESTADSIHDVKAALMMNPSAAMITSQSSNHPTFLKKLGTKISTLFNTKSDRREHRKLDMSFLYTLQSSIKLPYTKSIFLMIDSETLSETLCHIELEYFKSIGWQELLAYSRLGNSKMNSTNTGNKQHSFHNLQAVITRFNSVCRWVTDEVQLARTSEDQASILSCLIRIAFKCLTHSNYNTLMQLILTLQSPSLESLTPAWSQIPTSESSLFQDLVLFGGPWKNFKGVRKALEAVEDSQQACVPFTGLYLSDLMLNDERSAIKLNSSPISSISSGGDESSNSITARMIPFWKYRSAAKIIRQFRKFQSVERHYPFERHDELYQHLINVVSR